MGTDITCVILTYNEAQNITDCIASVGDLCKEIIVLDSGSTDLTCDTAKEHGARVVTHPFRGFGEQYNFGVDLVNTTWVLMLDSDERLTPALRDEIRTAVHNDDVVAAYEMPRLNHFLGQWIRHCGGFSPDYQTRLWQTGRVHYENRAVHPRVLVQGTLGRLKQPILHYTYDSIEHYLHKFNQYTNLEVSTRTQTWADVQAEWNSFTPRMRWKFRLRRLPMRPILRFLYMYVWRRGFLDGKPGFILSVLSGFYEFVAAAKVYEYGKE